MSGRGRRTRWWAALAVGSALLVVACAVQLVVDGRALFETDPWRATPRALLHTASIGGAVAIALRGVRMADGRWEPVDDVVGRMWWTVPVVAAVPVLVVLASPWLFDAMSRESRPVELLSALLNALTAGALIVAARRAGDRRWSAAFVAVAGCFYFVCMEEVSWFQRVVGYDTPTGFERNDQGEANLHNFATDVFQSAYYLGATALIVLGAFVAACTAAAWPAHLRSLVPGRVPIALTVVATAFNYAETTYLAAHVAIWITALALVMWPGRRAAWTSVLLAFLVVTQATMFVVGPDLLRDWAPSEYREMFLGAGFAVWAVQIAMRANTLAVPRRAVPMPIAAGVE